MIKLLWSSLLCFKVNHLLQFTTTMFLFEVNEHAAAAAEKAALEVKAQALAKASLKLIRCLIGSAT